VLGKSELFAKYGVGEKNNLPLGPLNGSKRRAQIKYQRHAITDACCGFQQ
jgi:hypothetical protein